VERLAVSGARATAPELVASLGLSAGGRPGLPRVVAIMIASVDGRATVGGTSGTLGHPEDRELLRGLRAAADCVWAGTGTLAAERYANLLDPEQRSARVAAGRTPHPLVATFSRAGRVPWDVPVFAEAGVAKQVYVGASATPPDGVVETSVHVAGDLREAFAHLHAERGVASVACEGGPGVLHALLADDLVDDLLLTLAPLLVAGEGPTSLRGPELAGPPRMALRDVHRADDHLFLHYAR
jgi:riboflavin biosynthesis pyrimidine reductase